MATMSSAEQIRSYSGPTVLRFGFRPFFLLASLWAVVVMALFLPMLAGRLDLPTTLTPVDWHVHELLYGYLAAVVAGFLLTSVPNWTGRLPVVGMPLFWFVSIWLAGRFAVLLSAWIGGLAASAIDMAFLLALGFVVAREIVAGRNTRNLKVLVMVGLLITGNGLFHLEALSDIGDGHGKRIGVAAAVFLIMLIGGRIVPSFTRNWLVRRTPGRLPTPFGRFDILVLVVSAAALISWVFAPDAKSAAMFLFLAALFHVVRLVRWAGERTAAEPLVAILHVAYMFVPVGFALVAISIIRPDVVAPSGALHGWTAGAIGLMPLAVMTRTSLGHTGRALTAQPSVVMIYVAAFAGALARIAAAFGIASNTMLHVAGCAWIAAFMGFLIVYGPLLMRRTA